ncbi:type IV pilus twitching motility protein PilT [Glutamicibacter ardleyensis]|uniref:type IV pilus twitching motility protein PilT n=1 Tax=Glutamicibacter ardleyensis TaxID=225894 RepID=UPI003FCFAB4A
MSYSALSSDHQALIPEQILALPEYQEITRRRESLPETIQRLYGFIDYLYMNKVSNAHVHPEKLVRHDVQDILRLDESSEYGLFVEEEIREWTQHGPADVAERIKSQLKDNGHAPMAIDTGFARVRATFRESMQGLTASLRVIPREIPTPAMLDIPEVVRAHAKRRSGLIIATGPTGAGKTTFIASLLGQINRETNRHIYAIEDPIEYLHEEIDASSIIQREIGVHTKCYSTGVADALRSKPHVILIGEILDADTARAVLRASSTGHLVFTTSHAGSVREAIESFVGWFPPEEQEQTRRRFADVLLSVVVQKLIPRTDNSLFAVREILSNTRNTADAIRNNNINAIHQQLQSTQEKDSNTMEQDLARAVREGLVSEPVAMSFAHDMTALREELGNQQRFDPAPASASRSGKFWR